MHLPEYGAHEHAARQILELAQSRNKRKGKGHVLVSGMTGSGKTFLVKQVATSLGSYSYCSCSQLFCAETGGTERRLAHLFDAEANMIILDDIDAIASKIVNALGQDVELRVLSILKYYLDKYEGIVVGITSRLEALDPEITRSGRLSHEIHVSISTASQRLAILNNILPKEVLSEGERVELAKRTHGYNFADLERLYAVAFQCALARDSVNISIRLEVFESALTQCRPFITADLPALKLHSDIEPLVGVDELKREILKLIQFPLEHGAKLHRLRLSPPRGALLYGPSGSGKTALALECALNSGLNVIHIQATSIRSKYVGESEKNLVKLFKRARECAPCILLIDQIEDLFSNRSNDNQSSLHNSHDRLVACLLTEMDGLAARREGDGVFILATTSYIENIDSAILRPGRIESHFFMLPFDQDMRRLFIGNKLTKMPIFLTDEQMEKLVNRTNGYSAAELDGLFREAALITLRDDINSDRISFDTLYNITR